MKTAFITHPDCLLHDMGLMHPERPERLAAIEEALRSEGLWDRLDHLEAPFATDEEILRVHPKAHLDLIRRSAPKEGVFFVDPDTAMNPHTLDAAYRAAGALVLAVDHVMARRASHAFCSVRPPGHHAEPDFAMGFCFFNNVAIGMAHALERHKLERVAVLDFDVHHGNGTELSFKTDPRVLMCSTFQHPFFPNRGFIENGPNMKNVPLPAGTTSTEFRHSVEDRWLPALQRFRPQMVFLSAGFDAHQRDPLANFKLSEADFAWVTDQARAVARESAENRIVSVLEGGYNPEALGLCVAAHVRSLLDG